MQYMLLIYGAEADWASRSDEEKGQMGVAPVLIKPQPLPPYEAAGA